MKDKRLKVAKIKCKRDRKRDESTTKQSEIFLEYIFGISVAKAKTFPLAKHL